MENLSVGGAGVAHTEARRISEQVQGLVSCHGRKIVHMLRAGIAESAITFLGHPIPVRIAGFGDG